MSQFDVVEPCFDHTCMASHENVYHAEYNLNNCHNDPDLGNHHNGNCNTNVYCYDFNYSSQSTNLQQETSLYSGNLAYQDDYYCTSSQSNFEQFGTM